MQKAIKIKVRDVSFNVEEDAVVILENYLNSVRQHFMSYTDGEEIIADIESSIAEKAIDMVGKDDDILSKEAVEQLIGEMGNVKDMDDDPSEKRNFGESIMYKLENFKLMRDTYNQQVAGVCAGLGNYFGIDPVIIRLIFSIVAIYGLFESFKVTLATIVVYVILWIAMPAAKTTVQRLEMKGEVVTLGNIEKELKQPKTKEQGFGASLAGMFESMFNLLGKVMKTCFEVCVRGTGLMIILGGAGGLLFTLIGFFASLFAPETIKFSAGNLASLYVLPDFTTLVILALIAGLAGFSLLIELGVVLMLMKNVIKLIPSALLLALTVVAGALLIVLGMHDVYDLRTGNTDNSISQQNIYLQEINR